MDLSHPLFYWGEVCWDLRCSSGTKKKGDRDTKGRWGWLDDFAFRITISWWIFVMAGAAALLIALLTISYQAIRAAIANPIKSLRTE